ncbi:MAG TPA: methyltransferase, FxLD system [Streptosporangiaceae bacterium]|nr:methyltransferase, FxLD system [Streptosporangiaceae bacterium]
MQPREPARSSHRAPADPADRAEPGPASAGSVGPAAGPGEPAVGLAEPDAAPTGPDAARARMVKELRQLGHPLSPSVQDAFATVPRHVFVPEIGPAAAYRDEALVIKCGPDGLPVSSSSQPAMMAIMLDQLGLQPGHRVLEIGTGSGYNAAVMSEVVGPAGEVVTIDIDAELVARARASLLAAGTDTVTVYRADGGYGDPGGAPFDRIIVTAGAWDIAPAWLDQLVPGGRLVLPLSIRGVQLSVALEQVGQGWLSTSACRCGFVRMLGAFAGPEEVIRLDEPRALAFQMSDGSPVDIDALASALAGPASDEAVPVVLASIAELADLDLWLTMMAGRVNRLTVLAASGDWLDPASPPPFGALVSDGTDAYRLGICMLMPAGSGDDGRRPGRGAGTRPGAAAAMGWSGAAAFRGLGPGGPELAGRLAALSRRWAQLGRPGSRELEVAVWRAGAAPGRPPADWLVVKRPSVTIAAGWPVAAR